MKRIIPFILLLRLSVLAHAQNVNEFPLDDNVGIGTLSPLSKLHVSDNQNALIWPAILNNEWNNASLTAYGVGLQLKHSNNSEGFKWGGIASIQESGFANSTGLALFANETEKVRISASGKVGIGVTNPELQLHLKDPSGGAVLGFERGGKLWRFDIAFDASKLYLGHTDNSAFFTLSDDAKVGIGTTNPVSDLHISDNQDEVIWPTVLNNERNSSELTGYGVGIKLKHSNNNENFKWGGIASVQESAWANNSGLALYANESEKVRITSAGYVGIGTATPDAELAVNGIVHSQEVKVDMDGWPDFVFAKDYNLRNLKDVENYINENQHLPEIPSENEVAKNGIELGDMNAKLLQKIEELTLYLIEQNKKIESLEKRVELQESSK